MSSCHLCKYTADGPHVDGCAVVSRAEQDFGSSVPEGDDFMCVGAERNTEGASKTEVGKFEVTFFVDQQVLGFEIAVKDAVCVAVVKTSNELVCELANNLWTHAFASPIPRDVVHVFAEVEVEKLEDEVELALLMDNVEKPARMGKQHRIRKSAT